MQESRPLNPEEPMDQYHFNCFSALLASRNDDLRLVSFKYNTDREHEDLYAVLEVSGQDFYVEEGGQLVEFDHENKIQDMHAAYGSKEGELGVIRVYNHPNSYAPNYINSLDDKSLKNVSSYIDENGVLSHLRSQVRRIEGGDQTKRRRLR